MRSGIKFILAAVLATVLFAVARGDLTSIRSLATDSAFYTTQTAELTRLGDDHAFGTPLRHRDRGHGGGIRRPPARDADAP